MRTENALAECMDAIEAGQLSFQQALERYPELREELAPLMRAAVALQRLPHVEATASLRQRGRARLMEQIAAQQSEPTPVRRRSALLAGLRPVVLLRPIAAAAAVMMLFAGTLSASAGSLPGDRLYPIKLFSEQAQLATTADEVSRAQLHLTFAERRVAELEQRGEMLTSEQVSAIVARYEQELDAAESVVLNIPEENDVRSAVATATARRDEVLATLNQNQSGDQSPQEANDAASSGHTSTDMTPVSGQGNRQSTPNPSQRGTGRDLPAGLPLPPAVVDSGPGPMIGGQHTVPELKSLLDEARDGQPEKLTSEVDRYVSEVARLRNDAARLDEGQRSVITGQLTRQRREIEQALPTLPVSLQTRLQPALAALADTTLSSPVRPTSSATSSELGGGASSAPLQSDQPGDPMRVLPRHASQVSTSLNAQPDAVANASGSSSDDKSARIPRWSPSARGGLRDALPEETTNDTPKPSTILAQLVAHSSAEKPSTGGPSPTSEKPDRAALPGVPNASKADVADRGSSKGRQAP